MAGGMGRRQSARLDEITYVALHQIRDQMGIPISHLVGDAIREIAAGRITPPQMESPARAWRGVTFYLPAPLVELARRHRITMAGAARAAVLLARQRQKEGRAAPESPEEEAAMAARLLSEQICGPRQRDHVYETVADELLRRAESVPDRAASPVGAVLIAASGLVTSPQRLGTLQRLGWRMVYRTAPAPWTVPPPWWMEEAWEWITGLLEERGARAVHPADAEALWRAWGTGLREYVLALAFLPSPLPEGVRTALLDVPQGTAVVADVIQGVEAAYRAMHVLAQHVGWRQWADTLAGALVTALRGVVELLCLAAGRMDSAGQEPPLTGS
jgi:hypothetical protein